MVKIKYQNNYFGQNLQTFKFLIVKIKLFSIKLKIVKINFDLYIKNAYYVNWNRKYCPWQRSIGSFFKKDKKTKLKLLRRSIKTYGLNGIDQANKQFKKHVSKTCKNRLRLKNIKVAKFNAFKGLKHQKSQNWHRIFTIIRDKKSDVLKPIWKISEICAKFEGK